MYNFSINLLILIPTDLSTMLGEIFGVLWFSRPKGPRKTKMNSIRSTETEDKNPSVYGIGNFSPSSGPLDGSQCIDRETMQTAGALLLALSESNEMRLILIEDASSRDSDHMTMIDQSGGSLKLVEAIRILDNSDLIELESYEWLVGDMVLLVYGPGDGMSTF